MGNFSLREGLVMARGGQCKTCKYKKSTGELDMFICEKLSTPPTTDRLKVLGVLEYPHLQGEVVTYYVSETFGCVHHEIENPKKWTKGQIYQWLVDVEIMKTENPKEADRLLQHLMDELLELKKQRII